MVLEGFGRGAGEVLDRRWRNVADVLQRCWEVLEKCWGGAGERKCAGRSLLMSLPLMAQ